MQLDKLHTIFFIGIGGIGMSALARYFHHRGVKVYGYDKTPSDLIARLQLEGMHVHFEDDVEQIPDGVELVVYTPAIPTDHRQLSFFREKGYTVLKRSEVLELLTKDKFTIAVAGSHGKTSVTSMITHLLKHSGYDCTGFVGGIMLNYDSNYVHGDNNVLVVEADEFDRSFLRLHPNIAVITAVDTDHLDVYGSRENVEQAFLEFTDKVSEDGTIIVNQHVSIKDRIKNRKRISYQLGKEHADCKATNITIENGIYFFDVVGSTFVEQLEAHMGGRHNVENALAAIIVADQLGIEHDKIRKALASFKGIHRRFEYMVKEENVVYIDDYAHHPEEIRALLESVKELYPEKKITAIFQPHLYSRTKDLYDGFAEALDIADEVILLDIYPAREMPMEGVTSELILEQLKTENKILVHKKNLLSELRNRHLEVVLTIGAGDIDRLVKPLKEYLLNKQKAA